MLPLFINDIAVVAVAFSGTVVADVASLLSDAAILCVSVTVVTAIVIFRVARAATDGAAHQPCRLSSILLPSTMMFLPTVEI